ncbi:DUF2934 domain-containing protein [Pseudomonas hormoni]|jgi:hypothetical protein
MIDESIIRERAYALWEKDACPEAADLFYWYLAREQLETALERSSGEGAVCDGKLDFVSGGAATANEIKLLFRKGETA